MYLIYALFGRQVDRAGHSVVGSVRLGESQIYLLVYNLGESI